MTSYELNKGSAQRVAALIPARGGSKGIPHKNIKNLAGKPLIAHSIAQAEALKGSAIDRIIVSTDSPEIAAVAKEYGAEVPFLRPAHLALDQSPGIDPVIHLLETLPGIDAVVLLQPTSPLRTAQDILECVRLFQSSGQSVVSVTEVAKHPAWMYQLGEGRKLNKFMDLSSTRRQDLPPLFCLNGAVYVASRKQLLSERSFINAETLGYTMPHARSVDLDTLADWEYAEFLISRMTKSRN